MTNLTPVTPAFGRRFLRTGLLATAAAVCIGPGHQPRQAELQARKERELTEIREKLREDLKKFKLDAPERQRKIDAAIKEAEDFRRKLQKKND